MKYFDQATFDTAIDYPAYRHLIDSLLAEGKTTGISTGVYQGDDMVEYSRMNVTRMKRVEKTLKLSEELLAKVRSLSMGIDMVAITEGWCGDAAQNIPVFAALAQHSNNLQFRCILRDEHPKVMDQFLTNGSRSIPVVIALRATDKKVLGVWGPRPAMAQAIMEEAKKEVPFNKAKAAEAIHLWYGRDRSNTLQSELLACFSEWEKGL